MEPVCKTKPIPRFRIADCAEQTQLPEAGRRGGVGRCGRRGAPLSRYPIIPTFQPAAGHGPARIRPKNSLTKMGDFRYTDDVGSTFVSEIASLHRPYRRI